MTREEWLEDRKKGIGGSDISAVLGINPHCTPYQLWLEKTGRSEPKEDTPVMKFGRMSEQLVISYFEEETNLQAYPMVTHYIHANHPFLMGTPDAMYVNESLNGCGILECKTTKLDITPEDQRFSPFYCQLQWYIGILASKEDMEVHYIEGTIAILNRVTCEFNHYPFDFDRDLFDKMVEKAIYFWENYIVKDIPPEPLDARDIETIYQKHLPNQYIKAQWQLIDLIDTCKSYKEEIKKLTNLIKTEEDLIKIIMKGSEAIYNDETNELLVTWKSSKDSVTFDEKEFKLKYPELYKEFLKSKPGSRRFLIK